ncbi:FadR/GntR family transcriptional regulator [Aeromicrobium sp. CF4.19]|uniref:FadR/GntR family transcriptional regulator n=1 Tax=Aeromicrobium sp. CF4.19 TaxID=3373082 RepID=UPI003EE532B8
MGKNGPDEPAGGRSALALQRVRPAYEQVAEQLRRQILDGSLRAGDRLPPETQLLEMFGVSRSTLREALRALAARDLVHTTRGVAGGTFVSQVNASHVRSYLEASLGLMSGSDALSVQELLEARETLEVPAARLAASRATPAQIDGLRAAAGRETAHEMVKERFEERFEERKTFHTLLVEASGNRLLAMMNEPNFRILGSKFRRSDVSNDVWRSIDVDHVEIADHVAAGDGDAAAQAMHGHLHRLRDIYLPAE